MIIAGITPLSMSVYQNILGGTIRTEETIFGLVRNIGFYHDAYTLRFYSLQTLAALILYIMYFTQKGQLTVRGFLTSLGLLAIFTIYRIYSKAGYLILAQWATVWFWFRKQFLVLILVFLVGTISVSVAEFSWLEDVQAVYAKEIAVLTGGGEVDAMFQGRVGGWRETFKGWQKAPFLAQLFGTGTTALGMHNDFLRALIGTGLIGLILYCILIGWALIISFRNCIRQATPLNIMALMLLIMWLIDAMGLVPGGYPGYQIFVWGVVGLAFRGVEGYPCRSERRNMSRLKVLVVGQLPPPVHGANIMAEIFIHALQCLGHEVVLVSKTFSQTIAEVEKVNLKKFLRIFGIAHRLQQAAACHTIDLCFYFITMQLRAFLVDALYLLMLRRFGVPYILYCHGQGLRQLGTTGPSWQRWLVRRTLEGATGALVLGERLKGDVNFCIEEDKIFVLPNAVPDQAKDWPSQRSSSRHECRVLFLSNLIATKGPWEFLCMAKEVAAQEPHTHFILAGSPVDRELYQKILHFRDQEGLTKRVDIVGGVYGEAKARLLASSDIFVYPTQKDAAPLVLLEAMQWGLPIISSDQGAIPEVVIDGVTGFIVDPKDISQLTARVLQLVRNPELRHQLGQAGRQRYEECYSIAAYNKNLQKAISFCNNTKQHYAQDIAS